MLPGKPVVATNPVYSLKKDGKERGAKNGEIMYDELDFWANYKLTERMEKR